MPDAQDRCNAHSGLETKIDTAIKGIENLWAKVDKIANRPPVWCTFVMSGLSAVIGVLIGVRWG